MPGGQFQLPPHGDPRPQRGLQRSGVLGHARAGDDQVHPGEQGRVPGPAVGLPAFSEALHRSRVGVVDHHRVPPGLQEAQGGPAAHRGADHEHLHPTPPDMMKSP